MHRERVPGQHHVHVALADQRREVLDAAGVHDDRAGDHGDAAARLSLTSRIICGDARDAALHATLRRDVVAHEGEAETVALLELRRHADAYVSADDALACLARRAASGTRLLAPSTTITASMRCLSTSTQRPFSRTCVR